MTVHSRVCAALPTLPSEETAENIIFQEDFSNGNLNNWTNIDAGSGKATIGADPTGSGATMWYPSVNSEGTAVTSAVTLPTELNLADGPISFYMRVRLDSTTGTYNNGFTIQLKEKNPNWRYAHLEVLPGAACYIARETSGGQAWTQMGTNVTPTLGSFVDLRVQLKANGNGTMNVQVFRYNTATSDYMPVGNPITDATITSGIFNRLIISSYNGSGNGGSVGRAYYDSVIVTQAKGSLPSLPRGENTENIQFQDDFANGNLKNWTNIATDTGKATIGTDPSGNGAATWYPSVNSKGTAVTSAVTLPTELNLADGPISFYMRVRLDSTTGTYNNGFTIQLKEKNPNWRYAHLEVLPGAACYIARETSGGQAWTQMGTNVTPTLGSFVDLRVQLKANGNGTMSVQVFRYNTATSDYVPVGNPITDATITSGIFNRLIISSYNGSGNGGSVGRAYYDSVIVTQAGSPRASFPSNAYRLKLPLPTGVTIQSALDTYGTIVLSKGEYTGAAPFTIRSGQRLYGAPEGTKVPAITVEPGTKGAVISRVDRLDSGNPTVTFPASNTTITEGCILERINGAMTVTGGILQDNLFLDHNGTLNIDTSTGGNVRNNRFIRTVSHAWSNQLVMLGDSQRNSYGNVFLWKNFLTPGGDATNISHQGNLTFIGVDAEAWNFHGTGSGAALWKIGRMGTLRVFGMTGGSNGGDSTANKTGIFDVDADEFQLYNDGMGSINDSAGGLLVDYKLGANNLRSLFVNTSDTHSPGKIWTNAATSPFRFRAFDVSGTNDVSTSTSSTTTPKWALVSGALPTSPNNPDQQAILREIVVNPEWVAGQTPWEAPSYSPIPDPAGPNWATNLATKPDSTAYIQGLIDANGVARLPSGIYYISQPLKLSTTQGIVGAGADNTVIIAKSNTLDMIVANDPVTTPTGTRSLILADLTLQGGANGIHFEPVGTSANQGRYAQYTGGYFGHVTFRNMTNAGIFMDQIFALDNIFFAYVHFANCDTGLKQTVDPVNTGGNTPTTMYMDKCVFYKSQFSGNRLALDLIGRRACNLNAWINCLFENNIGGVAAMENYLTPVFANCDFVNNGGTAVVSNNYPVSFVSCGFVAGTNGVAMLGGPVSAEGCFFDRTGSSTAKILSGSNARIFFSNCSTTNMPIGLPAGTAANGMLINTKLGADPQLNQQVISIQNGAIITLLPGTPAPYPQLLMGSDWSSSIWPTKHY